MARYIMEEMPDLQKTGKRITYPRFARIDNASLKELAQRVGHRRRTASDRHRNGTPDGRRTLGKNRRDRDIYPVAYLGQG